MSKKTHLSECCMWQVTTTVHVDEAKMPKVVAEKTWSHDF